MNIQNFSVEIVKKGIRQLSSSWLPYSRLVLVGDGQGWSLDWDMLALKKITGQLGIRTENWYWKHTMTTQAVFFASPHTISGKKDWLELPHRIGFSFLEGVPPVGNNDSNPVFDAISLYHEKIERIQVSHHEMKNYVLKTGIDVSKVFTIPIGIDLTLFRYRDLTCRQQQRTELGIKENAFVIGSFQKDGVGWGEGMEPKLVKGPDVFVSTIEKLKATIPELLVLLVGPSRGYVKTQLGKIGVRFIHIPWKKYPEIGRLFQALDLYLVTSRQEGGPKAILESMASGIPLVTTNVGQAQDLVKHKENGWKVDIEDVEGLGKWAKFVYENK